MELRQYWGIIWRRWWLIAILLGVVLVVSLATYQEPEPVYVASMRFAIGIAGGFAQLLEISGSGFFLSVGGDHPLSANTFFSKAIKVAQRLL